MRFQSPRPVTKSQIRIRMIPKHLLILHLELFFSPSHTDTLTHTHTLFSSSTILLFWCGLYSTSLPPRRLLSPQSPPPAPLTASFRLRLCVLRTTTPPSNAPKLLPPANLAPKLDYNLQRQTERGHYSRSSHHPQTALSPSHSHTDSELCSEDEHSSRIQYSASMGCEDDIRPTTMRVPDFTKRITVVVGCGVPKIFPECVNIVVVSFVSIWTISLTLFLWRRCPRIEQRGRASWASLDIWNDVFNLCWHTINCDTTRLRGTIVLSCASRVYDGVGLHDKKNTFPR